MADTGKLRRLFALHERFMNCAQLTMEQMMTDYGANRRTINRDLNDLVELGLDLGDRKLPDGRKVWSVTSRSRKIKVAYNLTDLTALFLGRRLFDFLTGTLLEESLEKVYANIENQLTKERDFLKSQDLRRKVYLASEGPKKLKKKHVDILDEVLTGLLEQRQLNIRYKNAQGETSELCILPYTLVAHRRGLYILGRLENSETLRLFALERIKKASWQRGSTFDLPENYDPDKYFKKALFIAPGTPSEIQLLFTATTKPFIEIRKFHHTQQTRVLSDGRIEMTLKVPAGGPGDFEVLNWIMGFGPNVEVKKPPALRAQVKKALTQAAAQYS